MRMYFIGLKVKERSEHSQARIAASLRVFARASRYPYARLNEALSADAFACSVSAVCL
jgi:hypothetical protein